MRSAAEQLQWLVDRAAVIDVIVGIANAFDAQDWVRVRSFLADEVATDYSQFRGEPAGRVSADAYVEERRRGLQGVRTLHVSTNHEVRVTGDQADCLSAYRIYRINPQYPPGEDRFDTAGTYRHQLIRTAAGWLVCGITQTVLLRQGNPLVHGAFLSERTPRHEAT